MKKLNQLNFVSLTRSIYSNKLNRGVFGGDTLKGEETLEHIFWVLHSHDLVHDADKSCDDEKHSLGVMLLSRACSRFVSDGKQFKMYSVMHNADLFIAQKSGLFYFSITTSCCVTRSLLILKKVLSVELMTFL